MASMRAFEVQSATNWQTFIGSDSQEYFECCLGYVVFSVHCASYHKITMLYKLTDTFIQ